MYKKPTIQKDALLCVPKHKLANKIMIQMSVISLRFKYQFACFAAANHLLNKQLLYLCALPHFTFKLCVCFSLTAYYDL